MMSITIGSIILENPVILAPMSGVSDLPFRRLVKRLGAGMVVSEMIASEATIRANRQTIKMAKAGADEFPLSVQLAGCDPKVMAEAARINQDHGAAIIDINMGCPVKKIVKGDAGAALMRNEVLAGRIIEAVVKAVNLPVTLKMRTGWDIDSRNAPVLARIAENAGVKMIAIHGRTRNQLYHGHADWPFIRKVKDVVSVPVIGNGDVNNIDDASRLLEESGADGVMVGRGSYGRPWLLGQIAAWLTRGEKIPEPSLPQKYDILLEHLDAMIEYYGEEHGCRISRKHVAWYTNGLHGSAAFRAAINRAVTSVDMHRMLDDYFEPLLQRMAA